MKWSKQKCRKVATIFSLVYILLGIGVFYLLNHMGSSILSDLLFVFFSLAIGFYFMMLFLVGDFYENVILIFFLPISFLVIWCLFYGIVRLIKGNKNLKF